MTHTVGTRVTINKPGTRDHGMAGTIKEVDSRGNYKVMADGSRLGRWRPVAEITAPQADAIKENAHDFSTSGLGIGGAGSYVEQPIIPTIAAIKRVERMEQRATYCKRCGDSDVFDGAMFTTARGSGICDDCFG